jgi:hypothetical protein
MVNTFQRIAQVVLVSILLSAPAAAQDTAVELRLNDSQNGYQAGSVPKPTINILNQLAIKGYYYDYAGGKDALLIADIKSEDGSYDLSYPVAFLERGSRGEQSIPIYGPWFYDGVKDLTIKLTLLKLNDEWNQERKERFSQIFSSVGNFIPLLAPLAPAVPFLEQGKKIGEGAWDLYTSIRKNNKNEELDLGTFKLSRTKGTVKIQVGNEQPHDEELPALSEGWYVMAEQKYRVPYRALAYSAQGQEKRPGFQGMDKSRVVVVRVEPSQPTTAFSALSRRLAEFLKAQEPRLNRNNIALTNPFNKEHLAMSAHLQRLLSSYLAILALRTQTDKTAQEPFSWLLSELDRGQRTGADDKVYMRLTGDQEKQVATALTKFFKYQRTGAGAPETNDELQGFGSLLAFNNWLIVRTEKFKPTNSCQQVFRWNPLINDSAINPAYVTASDCYALSLAESLLPKKPEQAVDVPDYDAMAGNIRNLREGLQKILRPQPTDPFMFFEQQSVAEWVRSTFPNLELGDAPKNSAEVEKFATELDRKLGAAKVLVWNKDSSKWEMPTIHEDALSRFAKARRDVGKKTSTESNHHAELQQALRKYIRAARAHMSAQEIKELNKGLDNIFPKVNSQAYSEIEFPRIFDEALFSVGSSGEVKISEGGQIVTPKLRFWRSVYDNTATIPLEARDELQKKSLLIALLQDNNAPTQELAVKQAVMNFVRAYAPATSDKPAATQAETDAWYPRAISKLQSNSVRFRPNQGKFIDTSNESLDVARGAASGWEEAREGAVEPEEGVKRLNDVIALLDPAVTPGPAARGEILATLKQYVTLPAELNQDNPTLEDYKQFRDSWNPTWDTEAGFWAPGDYIELEKIGRGLSRAQKGGFDPDRRLLDRLVRYYANNGQLNSEIPGSVRTKAYQLLMKYIDLNGKGATPENYWAFNQTPNVLWKDGKWATP